MHRFNHFAHTVPKIRFRLLVGFVASVLAASAARAQTEAPARYPAAPQIGDENLLIDWRRDQAPDPTTPAAAGLAPTAPTAATAADDASNPLRPSAETPPVATEAPQQPVEPAPLAPPPSPAYGTLPMPEPHVAVPPIDPTAAAAPASAPLTVDAPQPTPSLPAPPARYDAAIVPALHEPATPAALPPSPLPSASGEEANRRLAPFSDASEAENDPAGASAPLPFNFSQFESLTTAGVGLAVVVGLFLVCAWMLRRGGPRPGGALPADAFSVLGRAPLTPQTIAHLLRIGNKLVLVAMTPGGVQPLTEVTDPMEVDRLTGLCASGRGHGPSAEFQQVLAQLSREPARGFLGAEAAGARRR